MKIDRTNREWYFLFVLSILKRNTYSIIQQLFTSIALLWFCFGFVLVVFTQVLPGCFTVTGAIIWLPQCQWSNPEEYRYITVNLLSIGPQSLSDKNWEGSTGCPFLSMLNYRKNQCRSDKTVILNTLTDISLESIKYYDTTTTRQSIYNPVHISWDGWNIISTPQYTIKHLQGGHRPWKVLEFQWSAWKVLNF